MNSKQQQQLLKLLNAIEGMGVQPEELSGVVKVLLDAMKGMRENLDGKIAQTLSIHASSVSKINSSIKEIEQKLSKAAKDRISANDAQNLIDNAVREIKGLIPDAPDLSQLSDRIDQVEAKIPTVPEQTIETPVVIRDKLESLDGDERIEMDAIKGLQDEIVSIRKELKNRVSGGSALFGRQLRIATFSFTGDGATVDFYLPTQPIAYGLAINVFYQGQWMQPTQQYNIALKKMTMTFTPDVGTIINGYLFF